MNTLRVALFAILLCAGCDDPAEDVPSAVVVDEVEAPEPPADPSTEGATPEEQGDVAAAAEPPGPAPMPEGALVLDTANCTFEFVGSKVTGSHTGHFNEWSGAIDLQEPLTASRVLITLQMASVEADADRLTTHLRTDDFFDAANHPVGTFESTGLVEAQGDGVTHTMTGRLTLRGQTQTIQFPVNLELSDTEVRARAEFSINRQQWGINYAGREDDLIRDDVVIRFDVRAPRAPS